MSKASSTLLHKGCATISPNNVHKNRSFSVSGKYYSINANGIRNPDESVSEWFFTASSFLLKIHAIHTILISNSLESGNLRKIIALLQECLPGEKPKFVAHKKRNNALRRREIALK